VLTQLLIFCSALAPSQTQAQVPVVEEPDHRIEAVDVVEDLSEAVADRLLDLADVLRARDYDGARDWFGETFAGQGLGTLEVKATEPLGLGAVRKVLVPTSAPTFDARGFLADLDLRIGTWNRIESVLWKVKGAEFQASEGTRWGRVSLYLEFLGSRAGAPVALTGRVRARVERQEGVWRMTRLVIDSLEESGASAPFFRDVSAACGIAYAGPPFSAMKHRSFAWNGAAAGDVDGDGRIDIFVPSSERNYLYLLGEDGRYREAAVERGVAQPAHGTGAVLFDFDRDGDQDLVVAHVGWREADGKPGGERLQLYVNQGGGRFVERGGDLGLDERWAAYSLTVLDYDGDGWLDLFVCGYGRLDVVHNDSWVDARNGAPNALYRNKAGKGFEEVGGRAGVRGTRWAYAAAAADFDEDGDIDLVIANDYGPKELFKNAGDGTFTEAATALGVIDNGNGMGAAWGDLDQDGRLDLYLSNMSSTAGNRILGRLEKHLEPGILAGLKKLAAGNSILLAKGSGFRALPSANGGIGASWAWGSALFDLDLDGALDVFCTNGFVTGKSAHDT